MTYTNRYQATTRSAQMTALLDTHCEVPFSKTLTIVEVPSAPFLVDISQASSQLHLNSPATKIALKKLS